MQKKTMWTNDGFGPQLTGNETIVELFDSEIAMQATSETLRNNVLREGIDQNLLKTIRTFKTKVNSNG